MVVVGRLLTDADCGVTQPDFPMRVVCPIFRCVCPIHVYRRAPGPTAHCRSHAAREPHGCSRAVGSRGGPCPYAPAGATVPEVYGLALAAPIVHPTVHLHPELGRAGRGIGHGIGCGDRLPRLWARCVGQETSRRTTPYAAYSNWNGSDLIGNDSESLRGRGGGRPAASVFVAPTAVRRLILLTLSCDRLASPADWQELGSALARLEHPERMRAAFTRAAELGAWPSPWQRPMMSARPPTPPTLPGAGAGPPQPSRLRAAPWWTVSALPATTAAAVTELVSGWRTARTEALALLEALEAPSGGTGAGFVDEAERITAAGEWKELLLLERGRPVAENCARTPKTCDLLRGLLLVGALAQFPGCQAKLSVLSRDARVVAHTGMSDARVRLHLPLTVPPSRRWRIRAGDPAATDAVREWAPGVPLLLDDSFEHELWTAAVLPIAGAGETAGVGSRWRVILLVDLWHPDLQPAERQRLASQLSAA